MPSAIFLFNKPLNITIKQNFQNPFLMYYRKLFNLQSLV